MIEFALGAVVGIVIAGIAGFIAGRMPTKRLHDEIQELRSSFDQRLDDERKRLSDRADQQIKDSVSKQRSLLEEEAREERDLNKREGKRLDQLDRTLQEREQGLERRESKFDAKFDQLHEREEKLNLLESQLEKIQQQHHELGESLKAREATIAERLSAIAELSPEQAREQLLSRLDEELSEEQGRIIAKRLKLAEEQAKEQANEIIGRAIQRYAAEHTADSTTAKVELANDDYKGRIIGKEGRNIRAFEQMTGVDLIIDDTPNLITISCFDGVRREIARRTLAELLEDGRIHPVRIEEVLRKVRQDLDREVMKMGEDAAYECDVSGVNPQLLKLMGKLHFRTSYGQNVLKHSQEVAFLASAMAADMGLDPKLARRCGFLHDVGKALDHEQEGSHPVLGFEACKRFGENEIVQNAALAHHEGHDVLTMYTTLTAAADAISAARPGARRENVERYIKRLQQLEDIACDYQGVMKAYAVQAGRELRVFVNSGFTNDDQLPKLARSISRQIEDQVAYPGEVRVTTIRETRSSAIAR